MSSAEEVTRARKFPDTVSNGEKAVADRRRHALRSRGQPSKAPLRSQAKNRKGRTFLGRLESSFAKIRLLNFVEKGPLEVFAIRIELCHRGYDIAFPRLSRELRSLIRAGHVRMTGRSRGNKRPSYRFSLTARGRKTLNFARDELKLFVKAWPTCLSTNKR